MNSHTHSKKFGEVGFSIEILEESTDRKYIENREAYYIEKYDSYNNGLNSTKHGKGCGKWNNLGVSFSEETKKKMANSAKIRAIREKETGIRSVTSSKNWQNPEYRLNQEGKRAGKRLRPPKLTDEQILEIRKRFNAEKNEMILEIKEYNELAKARGYRHRTPERQFANKYAKEYDISNTLLQGIVEWKTRTKILPAIYKS